MCFHYGAARSGTSFAYGSVPAMPINLSGRALAAAAPQGATSPGPQCPNHFLGATKGWLATVTTGLVSPYDWCAGLTPGVTFGPSRALSGTDRLHVKRGAP